ncbi:hypothetical protein CHUAL_004610 [Chamberlinius hualienensis]
MYRNSDVYLLDDPLSAVDVRVGRHIWKSCFETSSKTFILVSHAVHLLNDNNFVVSVFENEIKCGPYKDLKMQLKSTSVSDGVDDNVKETQLNRDNTSVKNISQEVTSVEKLELRETKYNYFLLWCKMSWNCFGGYGAIVLMLFLSTIGQAFGTAFDIMLSKWIYSQNVISTADTTNRMHFFYLAFYILAEALVNMIKNLIFFALAINASLSLHAKMLTAVTRTKMRFFDSHQTGQIINRFSKDIEYVDDQIPTKLLFLMRTGFTACGILAVTIYSNVAVSAAAVIIFIAVIILCHFYRNLAKQFSKMEASARSPVYSYMNCTLNGVAVIRSHGNQEKIQQEFDARQDRHSSILIIKSGIGYWFSNACGLIGNLLAISIVVLTNVLPNLSNNSRLGVGISTAVSTSEIFTVFLKEAVDIDNLFVSIERVMEYIHLPSEDTSRSLKSSLPTDWPKLGRIKVSNLYLMYGDHTNKILNNINLEIYHGEKIGIVGRTGAGKSSLISALYRMADFDGQITIDGIDITMLKLSEYRTKLSIIPQNPVILSGSIRNNLDPLNETSDEDLWNALDDVQLKDVVKSLTKGIEDGMGHFSVGQKQLFCLARALLYKRKIIVFDEATSNIDNETDRMMQEIIKSKFSNSTLLVIAHRLQTVIDLDRIMVLHGGKIVEFDSPTVLLNNPNSMFRQMLLNAKIDMKSLTNTLE